ncbi:MAG: TonB-dependent receptor plug domain-containing protein [Pseudomonadota bacterium]
MKITFSFLLCLMASYCLAEGQEVGELPEIIVQEEISESASELDKASVIPVIKLPKKKLEQKKTPSLSEAVSGENGVESQTSCATCGSKRITVNGLRGEHTTILVDGVPLHSAVSSFYGVDAVPLSGVESIEISRGSGASLVAPEAIGGVINIITETPHKNEVDLNLSSGTSQNWLLSGAVSETSFMKNTRLFVSGQWNRQGYWDAGRTGVWDVDKNGVADAPFFSNAGLLTKLLIDLGERDSLELRYGWQNVSILGGTVDGTKPSTFLSIVELPSFQDNNVEKPYLDDQLKIADTINLTRNEAVGRWRHRLGESSQLQMTSSAAWQDQDSIYFHGYDYRNRDLLAFQDVRVSTPLSSEHVLSVGADGRYETMTSSSQKLYAIKGLPPDDFQFRNVGLFLQDTWSPSLNHEFNLAGRLDYLNIDWPLQKAGERQVQKILGSPRFFWKWTQSPDWTARISYGRGYRAPLSFFESQHGLSENGFVIGLTEIETAHSVGVSESFSRGPFEWNASLYGTQLSHLAYASDPIDEFSPAKFENLDRNVTVIASGISGTYRGKTWQLEAGVEDFRLPPDYKKLLPVAAVEQRARVRAEKKFGSAWDLFVSAQVTGPRNLSDYGYDKHYTNYESVNTELGSVNTLKQQKNQKAPLFATIDLGTNYRPWKNWEFSLSVLNLTNFTQTGWGDSPLAWNQHGSDPSHFHLDNLHVWGPLRGRVFMMSLRATL